MRRYYCFLLLCFVIMNIAAQNIVSPEIHDDHSGSFRLYAPYAKRVSVESDCLLKYEDHSPFGEKTRKVKMYRDSIGIWTYTTEPLQPEVYFYTFIVDGKRTHDPQNPDSTFVLLHQVSLFAVGGTPRTNLYLHAPESLRGRIDTLSYYSDKQGISRRLLVYVPNRTSTETESPLPILYLFHGISGDELRWVEHGRAADILDNLISQGRIPQMLVVMPDCNVVKRIQKGKRTNLIRNILNYPNLCAGGFEAAFDELETFIQNKYNVARESRYRAIAGLSSGARQVCNIALLQPDTFSAIGLFTPVIGKKQLPKQSEAVYHVFVGTDDMFYKNGKRCYRYLAKKNIPCTFNERNSGHTWRSWREFLTDFLPMLFKD